MALTDQAGNVVLNSDGGRQCTPFGLTPSFPLAAIASAGRDTLELGSPRGLSTATLVPKEN